MRNWWLSIVSLNLTAAHLRDCRMWCLSVADVRRFGLSACQFLCLIARIEGNGRVTNANAENRVLSTNLENTLSQLIHSSKFRCLRWLFHMSNASTPLCSALLLFLEWEKLSEDQYMTWERKVRKYTVNLANVETWLLRERGSQHLSQLILDWRIWLQTVNGGYCVVSERLKIPAYTSGL